MTTYIEDGGKFYTVEGGRVVAAANTKEELMPVEAKPIVVGDRVETDDGRLGHAVSSVITVYGKVLGIRLDGGGFENHFPETLKHSDVEPTPEYDDAVQQLLAEVDEYEQQVAETLPEIEIKAKTARALNIRAKALMSDPTLPLSDQIKVDAIITTTGYDIGSLQQDAQNAELATEYVTRQPRYHLAEEITPTSSFTHEDASWLQVEADLVQEEIEGVDWDAYLTEQAVGLAERLEVTDDEELLKDAISNHFARVASHAFSGDAYRERLAHFGATVKEALGPGGGRHPGRDNEPRWLRGDPAARGTDLGGGVFGLENPTHDQYESEWMGHDLGYHRGEGGTMGDTYRSQGNKLYSLRDETSGRPLATFMVRADGTLDMAFGPENRQLSPELMGQVQNFVGQQPISKTAAVHTKGDGFSLPESPDFLWG